MRGCGRKLLIQMKGRAVFAQLLLKLRDLNIMNVPASLNSECGGHPRGLPDDHVLRLHAHGRVRGMAGGKADRYQQVRGF
jgi:hypothetical protein